MKYIVIIPAYNESDYISQTLTSIINQSYKPSNIIVVNDSSTDNTADIVSSFSVKYPWIKLYTKKSDTIHLPGSKVIQAFNFGLSKIENIDNYDIIVKLDADLILPNNYFETIISKFKEDNTIGMVGGFAYIEKDGNWILENLTDKDHIRGAFKAYRKECFKEIGGLRQAMGWDTVDELLCRFYNWQIVTMPELKVKHLKPTGAKYDKKARYKQGEAFYRLHYGFWITLIATLKLAIKKRKPLLSIDYLQGFMQAKQKHIPYLVTDEQGKFIRNYRWKKIKSKLL